MSRSDPRPEVLAFLHAIKDNSDDDTPRLILADWLQEHGDDHDAARAELIRAQVEAARLPPYHPRRVEREDCVRQLCQEHQAAWLGPLADAVRQAWFERGLLRVEAHTGRFITRGTAALVGSEAYAWLEHVRFPALTSPGLNKLATSRLLQSVAGLELLLSVEQRQPFRLAELFVSENVFGVLSSLRLRGVYNLDEDIAQLVLSPALANLTALSIQGARLSVGAIAALAHSPRLAQLKSLELFACDPSIDHIRQLVTSSTLQRVASLSLRYNRLNDASLAELVNSPFCQSLTSLDLAGCQHITIAGFASLVTPLT